MTTDLKSSVNSQQTSMPFVSIILPIRNEERHIEATLTAVIAQDYPSDRMEILIADGVSTDDTRAIISQIADRHSHIHLQIIDNPKKIVPTGINAALSRAQGEIIIRVDGHTTIAPNYVSECVDTLQRSCADNAGGKMHAVGENIFGETVAFATSSPFGVGGARFHYSNQEEWVDTVYMGAWPLNVFVRIGLFDEELVRDQDDEFNYRLRSHGGKILLNPNIKSTYTVRGTPRKLWSQYYQYGFWKVRVLQKHPRQMSVRQFVPPVFVSGFLAFLLIAFFWFPGRYLIAIIAGTYLLANLTFSLWIAYRKGWRHFIMLPLVFATLHISYGLGFLVGMLKFINRWGDKVGKAPSWEDAKKRTAVGN